MTDELRIESSVPGVVVPPARRRWWRGRRFGVLTWIALAIIAAWLIVAAFAPWIAPRGPLQVSSDLLARPGRKYLLGADQNGRDVLSRIIHGARLSVPLSFVIVALALVVGGLLGLVAGYVGGWVDEALMRVTDLFFAFPQIILAMAVSAAFGPSTTNAVIALVVVAWPTYARVVRSAVLGIRSADYLASSRLLGVGPWTALRRDVLPNTLGPAIVLASLDLGNAVLSLAALSYLGLGPRPPAPEWGAMVASGSTDLSRWWISIFPGLAILTIVLAFNLIGDAVRDWFDPRSRGSG